VAQAALDVSEHVAEDLLDGLVHAQLLHADHDRVVHRPRYRLHRLVRAFIGEQNAGPAADDAEKSAVEACLRIVSGFLSLAMHVLQRWTETAAPADDLMWKPPADHFEEAAADPRAWLDQERVNLTAALAHATHLGWDEVSRTLNATIQVHLPEGGKGKRWQRADKQAPPKSVANGAPRSGDEPGPSLFDFTRFSSTLSTI
jgi:hypothetical protein